MPSSLTVVLILLFFLTIADAAIYSHYGTTNSRSNNNNNSRRQPVTAFTGGLSRRSNSVVNRQSSSRFLGNQFRVVTFNPKAERQQQQRNPNSKGTSLSMFMGSDGGILGVGTPEVFTILLVGYFVLGPSDLYKVVKEIGKFIQNFRTLGTDLTKTVETNLESQLQIEEIRKAQRELTDAFSFRRSINDPYDMVDNLSNTGETTVTEAAAAEAAAAVGAGVGAATATAVGEDTDAKPKKKIKRRVLKKKVVPQEEEDMKPRMNPDDNGIFPDLSMPSKDDDKDDDDEEMTEEQKIDFYAERMREEAEEEKARAALAAEQDQYVDPALSQAEQSRFASQLNANDWNKSIMDNEDKLSPLSKVMERLAILEDEKMAADKRLEEEFAKKASLEEDYYKNQRAILEEAAQEIQSNLYNNNKGE